MHHTREHHSRVWSGDDGLDDPWLAGHAAIDAIVSCVPGTLPELSKLKKKPSTTAKPSVSKRSSKDAMPGKTLRATSSSRHKRKGKATVCLDLDGVLAMRTDGDAIGSPLPGSVEFSRELQARAKVVIFTARFATRTGKPRSESASAKLHKRIEKWLDNHGFAWDEISTGVAKPIASAYIDDRAVSCRPSENGLAAFDDALTSVEELID